MGLFGVHGIGGTWGALATGLFASTAVNPAGADGLLFGNPAQLWTQLIGVACTWAFAAVLTLVILKLVGVVTSLRAGAEEEEQGLDLTQHGEDGYADLVSGVPVSHGIAFGPAPTPAVKESPAP